MTFSLQHKGLSCRAVSSWPMVLHGLGSAGADETWSRGRGGDAAGV